MKVLVLGGTRFIGPPAVRRLVEAGHEVTLFHRGRSESPLVPAGIQRLQGDRRQLAEFREEFQKLGPDVVLDMFPCTEADGRTLVQVFAGIAERVVTISSVDVYRAYDRFRGKDPGPPDPVPLSEDSRLRDQLFPYRDTAKGPDDFSFHYEKILMESSAQSAPDELPATVLRLPMVYGPGDYQHRLWPYLKRMLDGRPFVLLSQEMAGWRVPRGYVEDIGEAIALTVTSESAAGRTYHVADRENLTEEAWVRRIAAEARWDGEIRTLPNEQLPPSLRHEYDASQEWALDSTRIRQELGYEESTPPSEAMRRTVEWERETPPSNADPSGFDYAAEDAALGEHPAA